MKKIGFYLPHLDLLGTGVSCFDYAYHNEKILGNKSFFICDKNDHRTHPASAEKFKKYLNVIELDGKEDMSALRREAINLNLDAIYTTKPGRISEGRFIEDMPSFIHCCGVVNEPHGTVYAYVSKWLSDTCTQGIAPVVPLMVDLPHSTENLREKLNIPQDAIVFGRLGSDGSWNLPFVNDVINFTVQNNKNVYFLLGNTPKFTTHERVIFHEPFADLLYKRIFINTCDAMLHARHEGESYGVAVAEFSSCNKPVLTFSGSPERNHIATLKEKGLYYNDPNTLYNILNSFAPQPEKDWNAYKDVTPENVMQKFKSVFIDKL